MLITNAYIYPFKEFYDFTSSITRRQILLILERMLSGGVVEINDLSLMIGRA